MEQGLGEMLAQLTGQHRCGFCGGRVTGGDADWWNLQRCPLKVCLSCAHDPEAHERVYEAVAEEDEEEPDEAE